jgi:hypothetical protein
MSAAISTEPYTKGEKVSLYIGESQTTVEVVSVDGDEVTVNHYGELVIFTPRASDRMMVKLGSPDHEVMPTMIYRPESAPAQVAKKSFFEKVVDFFA